MNETTKIEIPVAPETARLLGDPAKRRALGLLVDSFMESNPPRTLSQILEDTARKARESGLSDEEVEAELAAYNSERRQA